jgi:uncharacterized protein with HEPN domain
MFNTRKADAVRIRHMLDAAQEAVSFADGHARSGLDNNRMLVLSLVKSVEILGEAATKISAETRARYPTIPWASIVAMRNRLIHGYFDINLDIVWATVTDDLPGLIELLETIDLRELEAE